AARFGPAGAAPGPLAVERDSAGAALAGLDPALRDSLELAAANIRAVAEAQLEADSAEVRLPQGQTVTVGSVPVSAAGIYAPGGGAHYPPAGAMGTNPARGAGVGRGGVRPPPRPPGGRPPDGPAPRPPRAGGATLPR